MSGTCLFCCVCGKSNITPLFLVLVVSKCLVFCVLMGSVRLCRSVVYQQSSKESATLQPFFTLQLDIQSEKIRTVQEALETMVARESVQGYTTKTKQEVCIQSSTNKKQLFDESSTNPTLLMTPQECEFVWILFKYPCLDNFTRKGCDHLPQHILHLISNDVFSVFFCHPVYSCMF